MGTGISTALIYVGTAPGWQETGRGPRLRQLFGGYRGHDIWGILRKTKSMEDDQGYLGFEEVQDLLCLKAPSMLFLWDIFSQQNELCSINELLTVACVFSSALLDEKARFLHAVFDASGRGLGTGSEIASICLMVLTVLGKVTGAVAKAKEVTPQLMVELEKLVPPYAEAVQIYGSKEAFQRERVIGQLELDRILTPSIRDAYETLPLTTEPVTDTEPPPPPGWASTQKSLTRSATTEDVQSVRRDRDQKEPKDFLPRGANPAEKHLAWTRRLEETDNFVVDADAYGDLDATVHRWLIMQDHEFSSIAKDLPGFRLSFCKSVCSSLGLPAHGNCVEVVNVTNGSATAIIAEFLMRPRSHTDSRSGLELAQLLEKQITSPYSALRRGPIGKYLGNAFLLSAAPQTVCDSELLGPEESQGDVKLPATVQDGEAQTDSYELGTPRAAVIRGAAACGACSRQEEEDFIEQIRDAVRQLQDARQRQIKAKAGEQRALEEIRKREAMIEQLRDDLA
eukprot:s2250_g10.t1